jgi:CBS-domain-containing membrane protein
MWLDNKTFLLIKILTNGLQHLLIEKNFNIARVFLPIAEFLKVTSDKPIQIHSVTPEDTVGDAFEKVVTTKSHRVYVIDDKNKLLGVISLVDLLKLINP